MIDLKENKDSGFAVIADVLELIRGSQPYAKSLEDERVTCPVRDKIDVWSGIVVGRLDVRFDSAEKTDR